MRDYNLSWCSENVCSSQRILIALWGVVHGVYKGYSFMTFYYSLYSTVDYVCNYKVLSQAVLLPLEMYRGNSLRNILHIS